MFPLLGLLGGELVKIAGVAAQVIAPALGKGKPEAADPNQIE
jgi:hypothetical protein